MLNPFIDSTGHMGGLKLSPQHSMHGDVVHHPQPGHQYPQTNGYGVPHSHHHHHVGSYAARDFLLSGGSQGHHGMFVSTSSSGLHGHHVPDPASLIPTCFSRDSSTIIRTIMDKGECLYQIPLCTPGLTLIPWDQERTLSWVAVMECRT
ncbi:zinc finger protein ZIC 4 [Caerostris extrusa]|uniref:Zinc finger protein ZIC 4 n=1 Tax=Caerostris extrusa TaxID=172846 RepID=A0AAV4URU9_CAEEX|nr:zinc finger protein ZIC 4 [Caerostris extrusa]